MSTWRCTSAFGRYRSTEIDSRKSLLKSWVSEAFICVPSQTGSHNDWSNSRKGWIRASNSSSLIALRIVPILWHTLWHIVMYIDIRTEMGCGRKACGFVIIDHYKSLLIILHHWPSRDSPLPVHQFLFAISISYIIFIDIFRRPLMASLSRRQYLVLLIFQVVAFSCKFVFSHFLLKPYHWSFFSFTYQENPSIGWAKSLGISVFKKHSLYSRHSRITGLGEAVIHRKALRITNLRKTTDMAEVGWCNRSNFGLSFASGGFWSILGYSKRHIVGLLTG